MKKESGKDTFFKLIFNIGANNFFPRVAVAVNLVFHWNISISPHSGTSDQSGSEMFWANGGMFGDLTSSHKIDPDLFQARVIRKPVKGCRIRIREVSDFQFAATAASGYGTKRHFWCQNTFSAPKLDVETFWNVFVFVTSIILFRGAVKLWFCRTEFYVNGYMVSLTLTRSRITNHI